MDAIGVSGQADIKAVIDDQDGTVHGDAAQLARAAQKAAGLRGLGFVAKLDEGRAGENHLVCVNRHRSDWVGSRSEEGEVDDGIKRRQDQDKMSVLCSLVLIAIWTEVFADLLLCPLTRQSLLHATLLP